MSQFLLRWNRDRLAIVYLGLVLSLFTSGRMLFAQGTADRSKDEAALRQAGKDYLAAMERGDAKAVAEFWTAEGTFTDAAGRTVKVAEMLAKSGPPAVSAGAGSAARPQMNVTNVTIRFLADDVAVEEGDCETGAGTSAVKGRYTALWVRQNEKWKLDSLRETVLGTPVVDRRPSLDVFIGDWAGEYNKSTIRVSAKWDADKKFLRREFTMGTGNISVSGLQVIGWDSLTQQIKSWSFLDDGSRGEGVWSLEGNVWMEFATRVLADGRTSSSIQVYKFPDKNTMVWKVMRGSVDGQPAEDFQIVLKRAGAK